MIWATAWDNSLLRTKTTCAKESSVQLASQEHHLRTPNHILSLTTRMILQVRPAAHGFLHRWKERARRIPDPELRRQALASIETKTFHCEGGALCGLLAGDFYREAIQFIVAYQTISDYLDNLCDRSTSQNPEDFRALHEAMLNALTPEAPPADYYRFRQENDDGGYLAELVNTCQKILADLPEYRRVATSIRELARLYADLQIHKHVHPDEREPRLKQWFDDHKPILPEMAWYEFAASAGSTLGIFCMVSQLLRRQDSAPIVEPIRKAYFPWVQGLHILLDYLIDQEEDQRGGDLNFCSYYENHEHLTFRLGHFYSMAHASVADLPDAKFHHLMISGLLSIYLSDQKVSQQKDVRAIAGKLLTLGGAKTFFFYLHCWVYRRLS